MQDKILAAKYKKKFIPYQVNLESTKIYECEIKSWQKSAERIFSSDQSRSVHRPEILFPVLCRFSLLQAKGTWQFRAEKTKKTTRGEEKKEQGTSTMAVRRAAVEKLTLKVPVALSHSHFRRVPVARFFHEPFHWDGDDDEDVSWKILRETETESWEYIVEGDENERNVYFSLSGVSMFDL